MKIDLTGKTAFISGSTRGIGTAIALQLAQSGCTVIMHGRSERDETKQLLKRIQKISPKSFAVYGDVSDTDSITAFTKKISQTVSSLDILINNAGITRDKSYPKMSADHWNDVISANLSSVFHITHALLPLIPEQGRIVSVSSVIALTGAFGQVNYAAAKAGILGFTKALSLEVAKKSITVNAVCPGYTETEMVMAVPEEVRAKHILPQIPLGRLGKPEEVASLVTYLVSDHAGYITGQTIGINGGMYR